MIAKAKAIQHGATMLSYSMRHESLEPLDVHLMPKDADPATMWALMALHIDETSDLRPSNHPLKNTAIRIEVSPTSKETAGWTDKDWMDYGREFLREFDAVEFDQKNPRFRGGRQTNLQNSQYVMALHKDSRSGIHHLHIVANRVDKNGQVNCDKHIGERAMAAAHAINIRRGWELPEDIHERHIKQVSDDCMDILQQMKRFTWDEYEKHINERGYEFSARSDNSGNLVGYAVWMGNSKFNASELGNKHNLTAKHVVDTWKKLHPNHAPVYGRSCEVIGFMESQPEPRSHNQQEQAKHDESYHQTDKGKSDRYVSDIEVDGKHYGVDIPRSVYDTIYECALQPMEDVVVRTEEIITVAILLYIECFDAANSMSISCGGGGQSDNNTRSRSRDDEDDKWARRCVWRAQHMCQKKVVQHYGFKR